MKLRSTLPLFVGLILAGCAGDTGEESAEATEMASAETEMADEGMADASADMAALADMAEQFETHYNMHHPDMVADFYAEDAVALLANGGVQEGRAAIEARLTADMEGSPTLALDQTEAIVSGDAAVTRGTWSVETTADGQAMAMGGNYLTMQQRVDGEWKIAMVVTNYNAPPPEGMPRGEVPEEAPADEGTMTEIVEYFQTHYNMGHGNMVASQVYADDAWVSFANAPAVTGTEAIGAELQARADAGGSNLVIHDVVTIPMGDGMAVDAGWYELDTPDGPVGGSYMLLAEQADDGSWKIKWHVSNGMPAPAEEM